MQATFEDLASAATPHDLVNEGLISPSEVAPEALTDGILHVTVESERLGSTTDGATVVETEHGHVPLQPGTLVNVVGMDEDGVFTNRHYIDGEGGLRDVLEHEDGSPYFPPVVMGRMASIATVNAAIREESDAPQPVPMHELYRQEGWVIDHDPAEPTHPAIANPPEVVVEIIEPDEPEPAEPRTTAPAVERTRPVALPDMEFTEAHQAELNAILNEQDVLAAAASVVEASATLIASEAPRRPVRIPEVNGHRRAGEHLVVHLAAGAAAVARTIFRRNQNNTQTAGRHRPENVTAQPQTEADSALV